MQMSWLDAIFLWYFFGAFVLGSPVFPRWNVSRNSTELDPYNERLLTLQRKARANIHQALDERDGPDSDDELEHEIEGLPRCTKENLSVRKEW